VKGCEHWSILYAVKVESGRSGGNAERGHQASVESVQCSLGKIGCCSNIWDVSYITIERKRSLTRLQPVDFAHLQQRIDVPWIYLQQRHQLIGICASALLSLE